MTAGQFVERGVEFTRLEGLADFDFLATVPPMGVLFVEDSLLGRRFGGRRLGGRVLFGGLSYDFFFAPRR